MKIKSLVKIMDQKIDEAHMFMNGHLISKMCKDTLLACYGDEKVKGFSIIIDEDGLTIFKFTI